MSYYKQLAPYAKEWSQATGYPPEFILTLLSLETGRGTSFLARNHNNHAGIVYTQNAPARVYRADRYWASYPDLDSFGRDFVRVLNLSYYNRGREAAQAGKDIEEVFRVFALGTRPHVGGPGASWDENAHSGPTNNPGHVLLSRWRSDRARILSALDMPADPAPAPDPEPADPPPEPAPPPPVVVDPGPPVSVDYEGIGAAAALGVLMMGMITVVMGALSPRD